MAPENLLVYMLGSLEIMAYASVVCMDKPGTLAQNAMATAARSGVPGRGERGGGVEPDADQGAREGDRAGVQGQGRACRLGADDEHGADRAGRAELGGVRGGPFLDG